ncbi:MAG: M15 family metallopeptidase [Spirochaetales bacterium]|nr:M15 family metallopeptidase [Spirochaetales bacterium]
MKKLFIPIVFLLIFSGCSKEGDSAVTAQEGPQPVHPSFTYTADDLSLLTSDVIGLDAAAREELGKAVQADPETFLSLAEKMLSQEENLFILVDKQHPLESSYIPADLINMDDISILRKNKSGMQLRGIALPDLLEMNEAARAEGLELLHSSCYRSYVQQVRTYNYWVGQLGQEEADKVSAHPGKSQHQLGLALDFGSIDESYEFTPEGAWQLENAWKYGWSLSYPKGQEELTGYSYECWHYRYIGKDAALMEHNYFQGLQQNLLTFWKEKEADIKAHLVPVEEI